MPQRTHDTEVQGYRVFTGKSHNTHNGIIVKYLSGKPATFFFDYTSSRYFGYVSGTCVWLFKGLGPEKHLGTHKMELRQGQDNMASSPLLYPEAFESITSGTKASLQDSSTFLQEISENISPTFSNPTSPQAVYFTRNK